MLEKPRIHDERISAGLRTTYGLHVIQLTFLPLGADRDTAVYRVITQDGKAYFLKLRRGLFAEIGVTLPRFLREQGIEPIIAPIPTVAGQLWANLEPFTLILYPYVEGQNGYEASPTERQWRDLGTALQRIHTLSLPPIIASRIRREVFSPQWRQKTRALLEGAAEASLSDPVAEELAAFLVAKTEQIEVLLGRAERLAPEIQARRLDFVLCHSDIHAGNLLIDRNGEVYIIDWDDPILAPKERDLMSVGAGLLGNWLSPRQEETLFYRGYGLRQVDTPALAYYRYERIIEDIAVFCETIYFGSEGLEDREQSLRYLKSNFEPNGTIELAYESDIASRNG